MNKIKENLLQIRERIVQAAISSGRAKDSVKLVAVSKYFDEDAIMSAYECGQRIFGENRVAELQRKIENLPKDIKWQMIGHLQSNKVKAAINCSSCIHSVDSVKLLQRIDRMAMQLDSNVELLLEFNVSGEETKFGATEEMLSQFAPAIIGCKKAKVKGLMTMAPYGADEKMLHTIFGSLRNLRDKLQLETEVDLPELSMGMSNDFEIAIAEGATLVRVGSAIFGNRENGA